MRDWRPSMTADPKFAASGSGWGIGGVDIWASLIEHAFNSPERSFNTGDAMHREETRTRIVEAAYRSLVDGGYNDTTIKDIAGEAGIAVGLAHYYFENKDDLMVAALQMGCPMASVDLEGMTGLEQARLGFAAEKQGQISNPDTYRLVFDMVGAAMHNPRISDEIKLFLEDRRTLVTRISEAVRREAPSAPRSSAEAIGAAIWGRVLGSPLRRPLDPRVGGDAGPGAAARRAP